MKNRIKYTLIFLSLIILGVVISCSESAEPLGTLPSSNCPTKTCGDFTSQAQAQATYNSNRSCYKNLDGDSDGIACENLSK
ncbi:MULTISPECIES: excalibur calcium-binding domain-containing protein [unclassified Flavobacterium]|uniref:excalibur calcium-binding domain-containing protein n=1 Tax=unclassified Flavobacterium TaxID=196869 RepID=UPI0004939A6D|nr:MULTISPECIES: excalibur calcium-binding domain-containing protein [unclassified Flavobacterium]MBF4493392.1 excalibur calcium-binding domain-containing protein [Flavobacterium sp. MR2016-29]